MRALKHASPAIDEEGWFIAMSTKTVFTTGEAAKICKVSQQTIIRCFDNGSDVALHDLWRKSAQTIVAAQLQDDEIGAEIFERCIDPGLAALCRFAAYAGVNDPMFVPLGIQSGLQQSRPGSVNIYAVTGTQAVAENYDSRRIRGI